MCSKPLRQPAFPTASAAENKGDRFTVSHACAFVQNLRDNRRRLFQTVKRNRKNIFDPPIEVARKPRLAPGRSPDLRFNEYWRPSQDIKPQWLRFCLPYS